MPSTDDSDRGGGLMLPANAIIQSFSEGTGILTLENGERLRFLKSACHGFEPIPSLRVVVTAASVDDQGARATEVHLAQEETSDEELFAHRQGHAAAPPAATAVAPGEALQQVIADSWITILLTRPLPAASGPQALSLLGLERHGVTLSSAQGLKLSYGGFEFVAHPWAEPFPNAELDRRRVGADFDVGKSFLGLGCGSARLLQAAREANVGHQDPWAVGGRLRALSSLVVLLLEHGVGVVLNRAGHLVTDRETFLRLLGDLRDPACRAFAAWIDWTLTDGRHRMRTSGMSVFALPDVVAQVDADDAWQRERRSEALLYACHRMIREDRCLRTGEVLDVPVGVQVGAYPLLPPRGDAERYVLEQRDGSLWLSPQPGALDAATRWQLASRPDAPDPSQIGLNTYQALLRQALAQRFPGRKIAELSPSDIPPHLPPHSVDVRERGDEGGFLVVTSGIGRVPQKGGTAERGTAHLELVAWVDHHSPQLAMLMSHMGRLVHLHGGGHDVWKPGDTVLLPEPTFGLRAFLLADLGRLPLAGGVPVTLVLVIPVSEEEYAGLRRSGTGAFTARYVNDSSRHAELRQRWRVGLH